MTDHVYISELRDVIRRLHGAEPTHVKSVPVKETFLGETVWDGVVEVFELSGHPKAPKVYAWSHETDDPNKPKKHVTVLHIAPVLSAAMAVRAAIREEFRNREPEQA
jgi:hypothetical protein